MDVESASAAYFGITVAPVMNILTNGIFGPHFRSNIIFALPLLEGNLWDLIFFDELLDGLDKARVMGSTALVESTCALRCCRMNRNAPSKIRSRPTITFKYMLSMALREQRAYLTPRPPSVVAPFVQRLYAGAIVLRGCLSWR
jgi:hypothetical protein